MPNYRYEAIDKKKSCNLCKEGFEVEQSIKEDPLKKCPDCKNLIERIITSVYFTSNSTKDVLSDDNIKKHGFTKLVKEDTGRYRKI